MKPKYLESNPKALIEMCESIVAITKKYHGHTNAATAADLAVICSCMILLSGAEGNRTTALLDEFEAGIKRVIGGFRNGKWLSDDPKDAGYV
jgi:hypothetical protein